MRIQFQKFYFQIAYVEPLEPLERQQQYRTEFEQKKNTRRNRKIMRTIVRASTNSPILSKLNSFLLRRKINKLDLIYVPFSNCMSARWADVWCRIWISTEFKQIINARCHHLDRGAVSFCSDVHCNQLHKTLYFRTRNSMRKPLVTAIFECLTHMRTTLAVKKWNFRNRMTHIVEIRHLVRA